MRCDCCPLCPIAEDDICPESEGEYGIEHADGMLGCRHPRNWAEKISMEYADHLGNMGTDMGIEMSFSEQGLYDSFEYFARAWKAGDYEPDGVFCLTPDNVEVLEVIREDGESDG